MDMHETIIGSALLGMDPDGNPVNKEEAMDASTLLYAVQQQMFCKATGKILDVMTSVLLETSQGSVVFDAVAWDQIKTQVLERATDLGAKVKVIDGRQLHRFYN